MCRIGDRFCFRLVADNGTSLLMTTTWPSKAQALQTVGEIRSHAPFEDRYARSDAGGLYTFSLHSSKNGVLARGEVFTSARERDLAIAIVQANGSVAPVREDEVG